MAIYSEAIWKPVSWANRPVQARGREANVLILHVAVSEAPSLQGFFEGSIKNAPVCSHFYVRRDGTVEQYIDTKYISAADNQAGARSIAVETQGGVKNANKEKWTKAQVTALAGIAKWAKETHGIPLVIPVDSANSSAGVAWHRLGIQGNFKGQDAKYAFVRGESWSGSYGKICPGLGKIKQVPEIVKLAAKGATPEKPVKIPKPKPVKKDRITLRDGWWNYLSAADAKVTRNPQRVMPPGTYEINKVSSGVPHLVSVDGKHSGWVHPSVLNPVETKPISKPKPKPSKPNRLKLLTPWFTYVTAADAKARRNPAGKLPAGTYDVTIMSNGVPHLVNVNKRFSGWVSPVVFD